MAIYELHVPTLPNAPATDALSAADNAPYALRRNRQTGFVENARFEADRIVYSEDYHNEQHGSAAFRAHMDAMADLVEQFAPHGAPVIEVGCGKGAFFDLLDARGFSRLSGFDTSYAGSDPRIEKRYVTPEDALDAELIVLRHTLEHVPQPHALLDLLRQATSPDTRIFIEVPCFDWIRAAGSLWDLTYEHVNYFTATSLRAMFNRVDRLEHVFDGQYLAVVARLGDIDPGFAAAYENDAAWDPVDLSPFFSHFDAMTATWAADASGRRVFVWGAGTKGVLLCHYLALRAPQIPVVAAIDINPAKQNRFTPGAATPILAPETALAQARDGDRVIVCNPNYYDEVIAMVAGLTDHAVQVEPLR